MSHNRRCKELGHQWNTFDDDNDYTYEQCQECGVKERFCKHDGRERYAREHSADLVQVWDSRFALLYPDAVKRMKKEKEELHKSEDYANEQLERAKFEIKRSTLTSKFVS